MPALAVTAYEAPPGGWLGQSFGFSTSTEYFTTKANYDSTRGGYSRLSNDNKFSSLETKFRARYNVSPKFSTFAGLGVGYSQATDLTVQKSNSQLTEAFVGADLLLHRKYINLIPELLFSAPMNPTNINQTAPLTSDGVYYIRTGLFTYKPFVHFRLGAFGGFHIPLSDLGTRFVYEVTADARMFSFFTFGGGINGYETLLGDRGTLASRKQTALLANAGSQRFYAFEPSLIEARGWIGFRPDRSLWVRVGAVKTLNGVNAAEGLGITASLVYNSPRLWGEPATPAFEPQVTSSKSKPQNRPDEDTAKRSFVPNSETTEQDLFNDGEVEVLPRSRKGELDQTEKLLEQKAQPSP